LLRPEQLLVSARVGAQPGGEGGAGLAGRVERCRYYGHDALMEVGVQSPAGARARSLLARVPGEHALPVGTAVRVWAQGPATLVDERDVHLRGPVEGAG
jgi:TOBE domain